LVDIYQYDGRLTIIAELLPLLQQDYILWFLIAAAATAAIVIIVVVVVVVVDILLYIRLINSSASSFSVSMIE
jgi:hypothetical protein